MRQNYTRISAVVAILLVVWFLIYAAETRQRSFSCRTFKSCFLDTKHEYEHPLPIDPDIVQVAKTLNDGTELYEQETLGTNPEILILALNKDSSSWSKDFRSTQRSIYDFLDLLVSTGLDFQTVSLALMTSSIDEFRKMQKATASHPFARTTIYYQKPTQPGFSYEERHKPAVQRERRSAIAALRNYLMLRSLRDEQHIFWIDADVVEFSPGILQTMLGHASEAHPNVVAKTRGDGGSSDSDSDGNSSSSGGGGSSSRRRSSSDGGISGDDRHNQTQPEEGHATEGKGEVDGEGGGEAAEFNEVGLLTTRCQQSTLEDYDKNAWNVNPAVPLLWGPVVDADLERAVQELDATRQYVGELVRDTADSDLVPLDSVGGTLLYIRARLVREGLIFPTHNVVGATWSHEGWTGLETEGICYLASHMKGGGCYLLGGKHHIRHADLS